MIYSSPPSLLVPKGNVFNKNFCNARDQTKDRCVQGSASTAAPHRDELVKLKHEAVTSCDVGRSFSQYKYESRVSRDFPALEGNICNTLFW